MKRKRRRDRPRNRANEETGQLENAAPKKRNVLLWAVSIGIGTALLGFAAGWSKDLETSAKLAAVGFIFGAAGGAFGAWMAGMPRNKDMSDYSGTVKGWGPYGGHYDNPLMELLAEEEYLQRNTRRSNDEEEKEE